MTPMEPRQEALACLLLLLFPSDQVLPFVARRHPGLAGRLPTGHPVADRIGQAVILLEREGAINAAFFNDLRALVPREEAATRHVERAWLGSPVPWNVDESALAAAEGLVLSRDPAEVEQGVRAALSILPPPFAGFEGTGRRLAALLADGRTRLRPLPGPAGRLFRGPIPVALGVGCLLAAVGGLLAWGRMRSPPTEGSDAATTAAGATAGQADGDAVAEAASGEDPDGATARDPAPHRRAADRELPGADGPNRKKARTTRLSNDDGEAGEPAPAKGTAARQTTSGEERSSTAPTTPPPGPEQGVRVAGTSFRGEAESCVRNMVWDTYPEGWTVRTITTAKLAENEHRIFMLTLYAGNEYLLMACGDKTYLDADLVLYDADGKMILQDDTRDRQPVITYRPEVTDTFYVAVHATERRKGVLDKGTIALAVTYK